MRIYTFVSKRFIKQFRVNKNAYKHISSIICGKIPPVIKSTAISRQLELSLCLRILAEGSYQNAVGKDYMLGMAQPTVSKIFSEVLDIMENELLLYQQFFIRELHCRSVMRIPDLLKSKYAFLIEVVPPQTSECEGSANRMPYLLVFSRYLFLYFKPGGFCNA